jgi:hypothetical protein
VLGVIPLESDGSFHIEVPAQTPISFQLLDSEGMAVAHQDSWTWVMPREWRGCIGCHEDPELAPPNVLAEAVIKPAVSLTLPPDRRRTVDWVHQVAPILARRCGGCHSSGGSEPRLVPRESETGRTVYEALLDRTPSGDHAWVVPGAAHSSAILFPSGDVPGHPALTAIERSLLLDWVDLGAEYQVDVKVNP